MPCHGEGPLFHCLQVRLCCSLTCSALAESGDFVTADLAYCLRRMDILSVHSCRKGLVGQDAQPTLVWSGRMPNLLYVPDHFLEVCLILRAGSGSLDLWRACRRDLSLAWSWGFPPKQVS